MAGHFEYQQSPGVWYPAEEIDITNDLAYQGHIDNRPAADGHKHLAVTLPDGRKARRLHVAQGEGDGEFRRVKEKEVDDGRTKRA